LGRPDSGQDRALIVWSAAPGRRFGKLRYSRLKIEYRRNYESGDKAPHSKDMELSHVDKEGRIRMVDTGAKAVTARRAVASARVRMSAETLAAVKEHRTPKGDPFEAARLAGIMAAKRTADLIPLCHPLPLTHIEVQATIDKDTVFLEAEVSTNAQTGVEMEALTAVSVAALTVYDMCKALEKGITITDVRLESKTGGKSGDYHRE